MQIYKRNMNYSFKKLFKNLKYKYRLVIYNESTFESVGTFFLSKFNIILLFCLMTLLSMIVSILLISFSPLKYYMPGYGDAAVRKQLRELIHETEVMKNEIEQNDLWAKQIKEVLKGEIPLDKIYDKNDQSLISKEDSVNKIK